MLWLCVYFPTLGLEVCQQGDLSDSGPHSNSGSTANSKKKSDRPTVLLANNKVMQRNEQAQQRGIHIGTSLAAAHSIAADLHHLQRNPTAEAERLNYLGQVLYGFSSHVCLDSTPGGYLDFPDNVHHSVLLEISASLTLFGGIKPLWRSVALQMAQLHHHARLQIAVTPLAALCGARWQHMHAPEDAPRKVLGNNLQALHAMPLNCLAISERDGESLHNMGLRHCGALLSLPPKELGQRFGKTLGNYLQRLTGASPDPRRPIEPPQCFAASTHLLDACTNKTALLFPIKRLCHEFGHWLIAQQLGVCLLHWEFANHSGEASTLEVRTTRASQAGALLLSLTQLQLERCELPRDVLDIRLKSIELEPWENHSDSLFPQLFSGAGSGGDNSNQAPLTDLLDKLRARLGPDVCTGLSEHANHRPEQAWQPDPLIHVKRRGGLSKKHGGLSKKRGGLSQKRGGLNQKHGGLAPTHNATKKADQSATIDDANGKHRPLWLLPKPTPVPAQTLTLLYGPERLQGGWWEDQRMRRDYYIAQTRKQQQHGGYSWVYRELENWFVHGYFG